MVDVQVHRIGSGPSLVVENAEELVAHFLRVDASAQPGGYDDLAGGGEPDRITRADIVAINSTMRARSPHAAWESLLNNPGPLSWLAALDPAWDLVGEPEADWAPKVRGPVEAALVAATGPGRGYSVGTKVLHLKRPRMFPVLDSLVLQQLGVTEGVPMIRVVEHLRSEGTRNLSALRSIQHDISPHERSLVRILDIILWASHPAAGIAPTMSAWEQVFRLRNGASTPPSTWSPAPAPSRITPAPRPTPNPNGSATTVRNRSFEEVWDCVRGKGGFRAVSTRGTEYRVTSETSRGRKLLIARPRSGAIYVHADCFGQDITCQGTRAGGIYNGHPSVWDC